MIRVIESKVVKYNGKDSIVYKEIACLSSDEKPDENIATGSICVEVDTGKVYFFDEENSWTEQFSFQE